MDLKIFKPYIIFILISSLFITTILTCLIVYIKYNSNFDEKAPGNEISLEITLPVIEWNKYENLSKKYTNGNIK